MLISRTLLLTFAIPLISFLSVKAQNEDSVSIQSEPIAQIEFSETDFNFGDILQGDSVSHIFEFTNIGTSPLVLHNVLTTCGCTAPEWPETPIMPGDRGYVKIIFYSKEKIGRQNKVITVRSNAQQSDYHLKITAMVLPAKKSEKK